MIVVLRDLFDPLAVVNLFDEIIRFASNAFMHLVFFLPVFWLQFFHGWPIS